MATSSDAYGIECEIDRISGKSRTTFYENHVTDKVRFYLRSWLKLNGMDPATVDKASDRVLANAYRVGERYIAIVNEDAKRDYPPKRAATIDPYTTGKRPRRGGGSADFGADMIADFDEGTKRLLEQAVDGTPGTSAAAPMPTNAPQVRIDEASIIRAAAAVIGPKIADAQRQLSTQVFDTVHKAVTEKFLSEDSQREIAMTASEVATQTAEKFLKKIADENAALVTRLERMIPRRLEIRVEGRETKTLPTEARHQVFDETLTILLSGEHVYMVGEAGTGKTHMFRQLGEALGQEVTILGQTLTKYEFSGHLGPDGQYVTTLLRKAVEEGHLLAIDEIDISAAAAIAFLNSLTANRFIAFPDRMVEAHPDFKVIAAANTFGFGATTQYVGRNPLDAASLDRFTYVECHYDEDLERQLYGDTPWTSYVHRVRAAQQKLEIKHIISMRAIDRGRKLLAAGLDVEKVCQMALWRNLPKDQISRITNVAGTFVRMLQEVKVA